MFITEGVRYIGVNDRKTDLFEGQYKIPNGIAYNSYIIFDEKIAVMDTVDVAFGEEWLSNLESELCGRNPNYLVVHHMEPDHSANIFNFKKKYPTATIVASAKAFGMMSAFFGEDFADNRIIVSDGDTLSLGEHTLSFVTAPMVHWPEVIMSYDMKDKILFSADAFGKFGALDSDEKWCDEARRYYIGIVGKYGAQVQAVLKKASALDIKMICPLHGPVLSDDLGYYLDKYNTWSSYLPEEDGIVIAYSSIYGNTKRAVLELCEMLKSRTSVSVKAYDLARCDISFVVGEAFRYNKLVLASTTYNADVFPFMKEFINHLTERNFSNRTVGIIENGSWAPMAAKVIKSMLEKSRGLEFTETTVTIKSALSNASREALNMLADELTR